LFQKQVSKKGIFDFAVLCFCLIHMFFVLMYLLEYGLIEYIIEQSIILAIV